MVEELTLKLIDECAKHRSTYLRYMLNNLESQYDIELVQNLYRMMGLEKESLEKMMNLLVDRNNYLQTITYTVEIYIERYNGENNTWDYYIFPQFTPNITDGIKASFVKPGTWNKDEKMAMAIAEALSKQYDGAIIKKVSV